MTTGFRHDVRGPLTVAREAVTTKRTGYQARRRRRRSYVRPETRVPTAQGPARQPVIPGRTYGGGLEGVAPMPQGGLNIPIETALMTGPRALVAQGAVAAFRNLPGIGRYLGRTNMGVGRFFADRSAFMGRVLPFLGGTAAGVALEKIADYGLERMGEPRAFSPPSRSLQPISRSLQPIPSGGVPVMQQSPLGPLSQGQEFPGGPFVVKTWDTYPGPGVTGGDQWPIFALLSDGRIVVAKPNGSWKVYRPKKNLVISSNPRLRDVRKLDRMHKRVTKMMRRMVPATRRKS